MNFIILKKSVSIFKIPRPWSSAVSIHKQYRVCFIRHPLPVTDAKWVFMLLKHVNTIYMVIPLQTNVTTN